MSDADGLASTYADQATTLASQELDPRDRALVYAISALACAVQVAGERIASGLADISLEMTPGPPKRRS
jgi:hypothetical protein